MSRFLLNPYSMLAALLLCLSLQSTARSTEGSTSQFYIASDGRGGVHLLWWIPPERWSEGGFRLEDDQGNLLVEQTGPGANREAMQQLTQELRNDIQRLTNPDNPIRTNAGNAISLGIQTLGNWEFAKALGLGVELSGLTPQPTGFAVLGLGKNGKPDGKYLKTEPFNLSQSTPLQSAPVKLRGITAANGVQLYWQGPDQHLLPILAYRVERESEGGRSLLTPQPLIRGSDWPADTVAFTDATPPLESEVRYLVSAIDVLGRPSQAAILDLFVPDLSALDPPGRITTDTTKEAIEISWQANPSPHTSGYIVERSPLPAGPYEILTPTGLPGNQTQYRDTPLARATNLFYRVRAIDPRGNVGEPGNAALARRSAEAPAAPGGLKIAAGHTRVRLAWGPVPGAFGYQVERRVPGGAWQALGNLLTQEPRLDDHLGPMNGRRLEYRVSAVAWGDVAGPASKPVAVDLPDTLPPEAPSIVSAESVNGSALLRFHPAAPENQTAQLLVLRGGPDDPGLVIGDPLPGSAREWRDAWVLPGETYWYRLVALDASGNRSDPGEAVSLRIAAVIPVAPPQPVAHYEAKPFARVVIDVTLAPPDHTLVLETRSEDDTRWRHVTGASTGNTVVDTHPRQGKTDYRVRWRTQQGLLGPPSPAISVEIH
ncbi:fibronectin type III domain-containing protein [Sedimenticola selenatireducens]|uniref:Fibronectin type-III domain-containing protein n=1 Tax=Sedimenticola selenatireducens TaxID=191960 RepID=A0A2N6CZ61_9GAMM|nr:fibronectin type III domain-containing protein [Sedimenticola selenatireducens]PLX62655.1 MAG: hypothetical protein C0630_05465 [Sedimenticola selenatireducens]